MQSVRAFNLDDGEWRQYLSYSMLAPTSRPSEFVNWLMHEGDLEPVDIITHTEDSTNGTVDPPSTGASPPADCVSSTGNLPNLIYHTASIIFYLLLTSLQYINNNIITVTFRE